MYIFKNNTCVWCGKDTNNPKYCNLTCHNLHKSSLFKKNIESNMN